MNCGNVPIIIAPQAAHSYVKASSEKGATKQELLQTAEHWRTLIEDTEALIRQLRLQPSYMARAS